MMIEELQMLDLENVLQTDNFDDDVSFCWLAFPSCTCCPASPSIELRSSYFVLATRP